MKKLIAMLLALIMALGITAMAEAADYSAFIGKTYTGSDPWGGNLAVTIKDIHDGGMDWIYADTLDDMAFTQSFEGTALTDGTAQFHVSGAVEGKDNETFDYTGTVALADDMIVVTYSGGELTEHSDEGGSTAYHVAALDELDRKVALNPAPLAEAEAIERFCDTWVADDAAVEIWHDGAFHCRATLAGDMLIEYERCHYNEADGTLACEGGTRYTQTLDEATQTLNTEVVAKNLTADFQLIKDGTRLIWNDSEGICKRYEFQPLLNAEAADAQEAQAFVGGWGSGRCSLEITEGEADVYHVNITWASSAAEYSIWDYDCVYDAATRQLHTCKPGVMKTETWNEKGEIAETKVEYEDGEATFTIDENDLLTWNDLKADAGSDLRFERDIVEQE